MWQHQHLVPEILSCALAQNHRDEWLIEAVFLVKVFGDFWGMFGCTRIDSKLAICMRGLDGWMFDSQTVISLRCVRMLQAGSFLWTFRSLSGA